MDMEGIRPCIRIVWVRDTILRVRCINILWDLVINTPWGQRASIRCGRRTRVLQDQPTRILSVRVNIILARLTKRHSARLASQAIPCNQMLHHNLPVLDNLLNPPSSLQARTFRTTSLRLRIPLQPQAGAPVRPTRVFSDLAANPLDLHQEDIRRIRAVILVRNHSRRVMVDGHPHSPAAYFIINKQAVVT